MRADIALVEVNLVATRQLAQMAIKKQLVTYKNKIVTKNSFSVDDNALLQLIKAPLNYVSKGGNKLALAIKQFNLDFTNKIVLDIGASTGGFTDCALQNGAKKVVCVDIGTNQLHHSLKNNLLIECYEKTDIRNFKTNITFDYIVIDVSFISITAIFESILNLKSSHTNIIALVKPQFEQVKRFKLNGGIIKDTKIHEQTLKKIKDAIEKIGLTIVATADTKKLIEPGENKNLEFLLHIK